MKSRTALLLVAAFLLVNLALKSPERTYYQVARVVDGDTIVLDNQERVRLIGVDTPEYHYSGKLERDSLRSGKDMSIIMGLGKVAQMFTRHEIQGKKIRLEYEWNKKDKYGRTLAYVYREPDGFFLNAEIVKQGYGNAYTKFPFKYLEEFRRYEKEAREQKRGLWADNSLEGLGNI